jgi:hypothetical protein
MNERGTWVRGRVTAVPEPFDWPGIETVEFVYSVAGKEYQGKDRRSKVLQSPRVGDPIDVLYHPDRPNEARTRKVHEAELEFSWGPLLVHKVAPDCLVLLVVAAVLWVKASMRGSDQR